MRLARWWFKAPLKARSLFRRARVEQELDEELQFHLDHKIEEGIAEGLSPEEARYRALRAMNGLDQRKEEMRDARGVHLLTDFLDDARYAARSLRRTPGVTAFVVVTLALGIGMTATPLSMLDALVFRPYPVPDPDRIVCLVGTSRDTAFAPFSYREYRDIAESTKSYTGVIANGNLSAVGFSAGADETPRVKGAMMVSGNYFQALGVEPEVGRAFRKDEDEVPGHDAVVVLGRDLWRREFSRDPSAVGRTIRLNGTAFTVIGVAPDSFPGMQIFDRPDFYVPLAMAGVLSTDPEKKFFDDRDDRQLHVKARLKPGVTLRDARNEIAVLARAFEREHPRDSRDRGAAVRTPLEMRTRDSDANWKFSVIFTVLALAVLLVACTNVAGLLLSRARTRKREIAVRLALGAGRFRLVRLLLTESLLLAGLGGLGGIGVGYLGIRFLQTFSIPSELPVTIPFRMDGRLLAASLVLAVASALVCGLTPALQSTRADLVSDLKSSDVDLPGRRRLWGRNLLVIAQIATSLMLLSAAFLMYRGFQDILRGGRSFAKDHVLMARFDPRLVQYDAAQAQQFYDRLIERMREVYGVRSAALTRNPPLSLNGFDELAFVPEGVVMPRDRRSFTSAMDSVDEGYFETMQIPILRGRGFVASDTSDAPPVAVVNEQFAEHYWPGSDAVGKRMRLDRADGVPVEIVGVAQTVPYQATGERPTDFVYRPRSQSPSARMVLLVRSIDDPLRLVEPLKDAVRALDANMPILEMRTYEDLYRYHAVEGPRIAVELVGTLGVVGLLLATAGLYGLVAYNVSRRTREIGIRIAVGAQPADVIRLVMGRGLSLVGTGTVIGLGMGFAVERLMNAMVFEAGGVDVTAYLIVVPAMLLVTALAAWIPARKASRIAPTQALRCE